MPKEEKNLTLEGVDLINFSGFNEKNIDLIRERFKSKITVRGENVHIKGDGEELAQIETIIKELILLQKRQSKITEGDVNLIIELVTGSQDSALEKRVGAKRSEIDDIILAGKNDFVKPKTLGQLELFRKSQTNEIVFAIGPAGTGKTYLAVAIALAALKAKKVNRILLSRPAVEAGESLGFLPGDLSEKVNPYLKPLFDALEDMVPIEKLKTYFERNIIEIIPLAYMRGRTLNNAFLILDEAQNATALQMKMFLTRLGVNSKAIITGDITQIDLPARQTSGLVQIQNILMNVDGVAFVYLGKKDVVRHRLVKDIINAYEVFTAKADGDSEKNHSGGNNKNENGKELSQ
ncbi:MAG: PhoH family protein [Chlorobi bacterium]|nr:PhoH family protein [Chlorobiota bacterium]MCI0716995.1 PhoH family protein [Chlorobiota bacterium]